MVSKLTTRSGLRKRDARENLRRGALRERHKKELQSLLPQVEGRQEPPDRAAQVPLGGEALQFGARLPRNGA